MGKYINSKESKLYRKERVYTVYGKPKNELHPLEKYFIEGYTDVMLHQANAGNLSSHLRHLIDYWLRSYCRFVSMLFI
jgi:hypothetical protein